MSAKRGWGFLWGVLLVIGGLVGSRPAHAEVVINERTPMMLVRENPCNGEMVEIQAVQHLIMKVTENGSGGLHIDVFTSTHGEGIDKLGNSYRVSEQDHNVQNIQGTLDHFSTTLQVHFNMVCRGKAPNFVSHALLHLTFTNGQFTAVADQLHEECQG